MLVGEVGGLAGWQHRDLQTGITVKHAVESWPGTPQHTTTGARRTGLWSEPQVLARDLGDPCLVAGWLGLQIMIICWKQRWQRKVCSKSVSSSTGQVGTHVIKACPDLSLPLQKTVSKLASSRSRQIQFEGHRQLSKMWHCTMSD